MHVITGLGVILSEQDAIEMWNENRSHRPVTTYEEVLAQASDVVTSYEPDEVRCFCANVPAELAVEGYGRIIEHDLATEATERDATQSRVIILWASRQPSFFSTAYRRHGEVIDEIRKAYQPLTRVIPPCWDRLAARIAYIEMAIEG